jgi:hypothetical protein
MKAVEVLIEHGVPEERIIFINLVSHFFTTFRLDTYLESKDCLTRRIENILWEISYFTRRMFLLQFNVGRADWSQWSTDNRVDRPGIEREGLYHPRIRRFWGKKVCQGPFATSYLLILVIRYCE